MKRLLYRVLPWIVTIVALFIAFRGIDLRGLLARMAGAGHGWLLAALALTASSYLLRARRWQFLFPRRIIGYTHSLQVLVLGFFMNNILPARTGELVRAHMGSVVTSEKRTLVLATVASERLLDGLMLSAMFLVFGIGVGGREFSHGLLLVAAAFGGVAVLVVMMLWQRARVFTLFDRLTNRLDDKASQYTADRIQVFINGLMPLCNRRRLPVIALWTTAVWGIELAVFALVSIAYDHPLPLDHAVLFLVSVNFSSLIPAAPGGVGVIEAVASAVLVSLGIEHEVALSMVMSQHFIQYLVVGAPGAAIMLSWRSRLSQMKETGHGSTEDV